jgi:hypothetical protein
LTRSDLFGEHPSVAILPVTSEWRARAFFRIVVTPADANGLGKLSPIMTDRI